MALITANSKELEAHVRNWLEGTPTVIALCAAWCDTCVEFRTTLESIAQARPHVLFIWLDIEDDSEICGDIDVENFPTLAIFRGACLLHYGVSLPLEGSVGRLVDEVAARREIGIRAAQVVLDLPHRLLAHVASPTT